MSKQLHVAWHFQGVWLIQLFNKKNTSEYSQTLRNDSRIRYQPFRMIKSTFASRSGTRFMDVEQGSQGIKTAAWVLNCLARLECNSRICFQVNHYQVSTCYQQQLNKMHFLLYRFLLLQTGKIFTRKWIYNVLYSPCTLSNARIQHEKFEIHQF